MKFRDGLIAARSHIVFVVALLVAFGLIYMLDRSATGLREDAALVTVDEVVAGIDVLPIAPHAPLDEQQMQAGRTAWAFFINNTDPETGLANAADKYPSTTMWDTGSYLIGLVSAHRLGIVAGAEFDSRVTRALASLAKLPLFDGKLPNKALNTKTLAMTNYGNTVSERGIGWSSLDIARLIVSLQAIARSYPEHAGEVVAVTAGWDLSVMVNGGLLIGSAVNDADITVLTQEGRSGYEQYGAKAAMLMALDAGKAAQVQRNVNFKMVEDLPIPVDTRLIAQSVPAFVTSEPYMLDGLEFGLDSVSQAFASNVYRVQELRYRDTGILTAVSEGHLSKKPYFGYSTVWGGGMPWAVMTLRGARHDSLRTLSTKTAFAWDALFSTDYTRQLVASVADLAIPDRGWQEGRYEIDGTPNTTLTANTNGIILASLAFRVYGPLLRPRELAKQAQ